MKNNAFTNTAVNHPKAVVWISVIISLLLTAFIVKVKVDTDPENMLAADEPVRVFHNQVKKEFNLYDVLVLGVVNEKDPNGVFNPRTLKNIEILTDFAATPHSAKDPDKRAVAKAIIAPGNTEAIIQSGPGQISFKWLMKHAPADQKGSLQIRDLAMDNPLLKGTLVSEDGRAIAIYLPLTAKSFAAEARDRLLDKITELEDNGDQYYITGLPVAEDTFGQEMFIQMAISAPLAMLAIFLLMLVFFKKVKLILAPMLVAMLSVMCSMGLFIGMGNTLHIMSSMIPIFLMPIAVVDSIHILSEFFDSYQSIKDRRQTVEHVMGQLFTPMLYTSLTSAAGFASLAMTPIPPVQVFGIYVAIGIMLAWVFTVLVVPAYIMLMNEAGFENFGAMADKDTGAHDSAMSRMLSRTGLFTYRRAKTIIAVTLLLVAIAGYGITRIVINDNPINWFTASHPIRIADKVLNKHFGGTYEAYLVLEQADSQITAADLAMQAKKDFQKILAHDPDRETILAKANQLVQQALAAGGSPEDFAGRLAADIGTVLDTVGDDHYDAWADLLAAAEQLADYKQIFKRPEMLRYIERLQQVLQKSGMVGKSNSVADVVKKIHKELFSSDPAHFTIPDSVGAVAQCLISYQNSHKPDDLWHLVTPDYGKANIWVQLKNGDNIYMEEVLRDVEDFMAKNPPPLPLKHRWAGLTYINVEWQDKMVSGMRDSFMGSFGIVLVMMIFLFRSPLWGLLSMVPLSVTIALIYGVIGLIGKDYDMPVAVLSSLTLGLAVDFAIHFLERARATYKNTGSWKQAARIMFEEPARAITRNVIVIAIGFTPLLAAPLVPYKTVGVLLATIMAVSGLATMLILPAVITLFEKRLFRSK